MKYVKKYVVMYVDVNCDVVVIVLLSVVMFVSAAVDAYVDVILRAFVRYVRGKCVVYVVLNGGFIFVGNLMFKVVNGDVMVCMIFEWMKGVVFDCVFGNLRFDIVARAFVVVVGGVSVMSELLLYFEVFVLWLLGRRVFSECLLRIDELWGKAGALELILLRCSSMFMYSEVDVLIFLCEIEVFVMFR